MRRAWILLLLFALVAAAAACGGGAPTSLPCRAQLGHALASRTLALTANASATVDVGVYAVSFVIAGQPVDGRGEVRIAWEGRSLAPGSVSAAFDARRVASISGRIAVSEGTLLYSCGAFGRA